MPSGHLNDIKNFHLLCLILDSSLITRCDHLLVVMESPNFLFRRFREALYHLIFDENLQLSYFYSSSF